MIPGEIKWRQVLKKWSGVAYWQETKHVGLARRGVWMWVIGVPVAAILAGFSVGASAAEKSDLVRIEVRDAAGAVVAEAHASG
jgi:hypothetical protein